MIIGFVGVIGGVLHRRALVAHPPLGTVAKHAVVPQFQGSESLLLAVGILGATVMPHVIYLHSALTQNRIVPRNEDEARRLYRFTRIDVVIAMSIAGLINMAMLVVAAARLLRQRPAERRLARDRSPTLEPLLGGASSALFALALIALRPLELDGGTLAGQVVMQGFIERQIPISSAAR